MTEDRHDAHVEVSIIVALFNGERFVGDLLESLVRQEHPPPFEVLVCDNGSTDRSREVVGAFAERVRLTVIDAAERRGQAHARNRGAARANGHQLLFLDQDDVVDEAYVASMSRMVSRHQMAAARIDTVRLNRGWHGAPRQLAQEASLGEAAMGAWGYGSTLGFERSLFSALGGFDESLPFACEDVDLCWRARVAGQDLHYAREALLYYRFPGSVRQLLRQGTTYGRAYAALTRKWAASGVEPFPRHRAARRVGYFGLRAAVARTRAGRGRYAFLLGRYWGLLVVRPLRRRRPRLRPGERPTVLVVTASDDRRGAEIEATELAAELQARGLTASVTALSPGRRERRLAIPSFGRRPLAPSTLLALRRAAGDVDLVIAYGSSTLPACAIALRLSGRPFVYRSISDPGRWIRHDLHRRITGLQVRRAVRVVALWPAAASSLQHLYGLAADRTAIIPNARHARDFRPPSGEERRAARARLGLPDRPIVAFVGSLTPEKRIDLAIDAVACTDGYVLVVAGDGPERVQAERRGQTLGLAAVWLGDVDDVATVLHAADAVLITSAIEGMPGVAIEAEMCAVPVVSTDVGALSSMPGVHVTTSDKTSLAAVLKSVVAKPTAEREPLAVAFDWKYIGDMWTALIDDVCRRRP